MNCLKIFSIYQLLITPSIYNSVYFMMKVLLKYKLCNSKLQTQARRKGNGGAYAQCPGQSVVAKADLQTVISCNTIYYYEHVKGSLGACRKHCLLF